MSKLTTFEPNATYQKDGKTEKLFTYDSALSVESAMRAIDVWKYDYKYPIDRAWIDVREGEKVTAIIEVAV